MTRFWDDAMDFGWIQRILPKSTTRRDRMTGSMLALAMQHYGDNLERNRTFFKELFEGFPYPLSSNYCGIFMKYLALNATPWIDPPKAPEVARSWLTIGQSVSSPELGDIAIFWREAKQSWKGHVTIFISHKNESHAYCLGGNQGYDKSINVSAMDKSRLLGYRRLVP